MEKTGICGKIELAIDAGKTEYQEAEDDSYLSTVLASKVESLEILLEQVKGGKTGERMLAELKEKLPGIEKEMEREAEYPTFDWYDEHHTYKVLEGHRDAYLKVIEILEQDAAPEEG